MKIIYLNFDLTETNQGMILHGVNCSGFAFNAGVAKAIRTKWPITYERYKQFPSGKQSLGKIDVIEIQPKLVVVNGYTQIQFGRKQKPYASEDAIYKVIKQSLELAKNKKLLLLMPKIGCGLGGLDWDENVKPIVEQAIDEIKHPIVVCEI